MVMVDEYQDTNPVQDAVINLVTPDQPAGGGGRPRFIVGDLKQSIYGFRLAEPRLFAKARSDLQILDDSLGRVVRLGHNFRSHQRVIDAVNHLFDGLMTESLGGENYQANRLICGLDYDALYASAGAASPAAAVRLHLIDLDAEEDNGGEEVEVASAKPGKRLIQARQVAALICELHDSGPGVYDKQAGKTRRICWRDVAVLLRSTVGYLEPLQEALAEAGVPYYALGRSGFYERPEVADALSLLSVIDNPRLDIPLAAVLRGPFVGLIPEELLELAFTGGKQEDLCLWDKLTQYAENGPDEDLRQRLAAFRGWLERTRTFARREPLPELVWRVYADTGLLTAMAGLKGGEQRVANLLAVHDLARQFANWQQQGLGRFVRHLRQGRKLAGDTGEAPTLSEAVDAVQLMTVHQAKGLEFPVVVLPFLEKQFNLEDLKGNVLWHRQAGMGGREVDLRGEQPSRAETIRRRLVARALKQDLQSEELRLLYVALTRARERLELVGLGDQQQRGKFSAVLPTSNARSWLYWVGSRLAPVIAELQPGESASVGVDDCWEVLLHKPLARPSARAATPQAAEALSEEQCDAIREKLSWRYPWKELHRLPAKVTVTHLAHLPPRTEEADGEYSVNGSRQLYLPEPPLPRFLQGERVISAAETGTATHRLLARLDFTAHYDREIVEALRDELVQGGLLDTQAAMTIDCAAVAQLAKDLARFVQDADDIRTELPVGLLLPANDPSLCDLFDVEPAKVDAGEHVYVQGTLDLLVVNDHGALVLDHKTDRAGADELKARYARQLGWYCRAVEVMLPDTPVRWGLYGLAGAGLIGPIDWDGA
jgi:ATP-dependent helicase/nuclease subunit A